jgi:hypothetical protein
MGGSPGNSAENLLRYETAWKKDFYAGDRRFEAASARRINITALIERWEG